MITLQKFYLTKTMITDFRCLLYASSYRWTMSSIPQILLFFYLFPVFYFTIQFEINAHFEDFVVLKSLLKFSLFILGILIQFLSFHDLLRFYSFWSFHRWMCRIGIIYRFLFENYKQRIFS